MSKVPWEMTVEEAMGNGGGAVPPPIPQEPVVKKNPWEMAFEEIRGFFKPTKPKVPPASPTPPPEPSRASSEPLYPTETSMRGQGILSPAEQARASAFEKSDANLAMLDEELSRKGLSKEARKILEDERKKIVKARGAATSQKEIGASTDVGDAKLKTLLDNASENSDFKTLYSFLKDKNSLPNMKVDTSLSSRGEFSYGDGQPAEGNISVGGSSKGFVSTLVHEMTHAADRQMIQLSLEIEKSIRKGEKVSKEEEQFLSNWKKSFGARSVGEGGGEAVGLKSLMKAIADPKWLSENQDYRTTRAESIAHGVGNVNKKSSEIYNLQTHMDPSIATEFMILLDQANKIRKKRKE